VVQIPSQIPYEKQIFMIFKTRPNIKKQFDIIHDFGIKNLIVSGCSFTYNNHNTSAVAWPYYFRDIGGFEQVLDTSMPGAGNQHIANSLQWAIEIDQPDPADSLVIVMWSGNDRDDYICPIENDNNNYPFTFNYSNKVVSGITGGLLGCGNTLKGLVDLGKTKSLESRAIENYLIISSLYNFLQNKGYKFIFLDYLDRSLPSRTKDFEILPLLPSNLAKNLKNMLTPNTNDLYTWSLGRNYLSDDLIHPTPDGHLNWAKKILLPISKSYLK